MDIISAFQKALKPIDASIAHISDDAIENKLPPVIQEITAKFKNGDLITLARKSVMSTGKKIHFYELAYRELMDPVINIFGKKKYFSVINSEFFYEWDGQLAVEAFAIRTTQARPKLVSGLGLKSIEEITNQVTKPSLVS